MYRLTDVSQMSVSFDSYVGYGGKIVSTLFVSSAEKSFKLENDEIAEFVATIGLADTIGAAIWRGEYITLRRTEDGWQREYEYQQYSVTDNVPASDGYWVSPSGAIFVVGFVGHRRSARELVSRYYPTAAETRDEVGYLESKFWIHISGQNIFYEKEINDKQYEAIVRLIDLNEANRDAELSYQFSMIRALKSEIGYR